jgi:hypothetical protein
MIDVEKELSALAKISRIGLQDRWQKLYGAEPPAHISRDLMVRTIAHRIQEREYGGLDKNTKRKLRSLALALDSEGERPLSPGLTLKPGAKLIREWHGRTYTVVALEKGFEFKGKRYRSLSRIAREITGARWSGLRFFGLTRDAKTTSQANGDAL